MHNITIVNTFSGTTFVTNPLENISTNKNISNYKEDELKQILNNGSYIKNVSENIKKFDRLWAKMK